MNRRVAKQPKKRSQRVAAWIYEVINPIIEGLERELYFLQSGNATWRYFSQRCEFIRPVQEYVESAQLPNYSDFLVEHPEFKKKFQTHEKSLSALNNSANALYRALLANPQFAEKVSSSIRMYEELRLKEPHTPDLGYIKQDLDKLMAEYLINDISDLPSHYATARFWALTSSDLRAFRNSTDLFDSLRTAESMFAAESQRLISDLEIKRGKFSDTFDLPAARTSDFFLNR
jgi:hypothetical protein